MTLPEESWLLRVHCSERDRHDGLPLYEAIVRKARELHLAGATVLNLWSSKSLRGVCGASRHRSTPGTPTPCHGLLAHPDPLVLADVADRFS